MEFQSMNWPWAILPSQGQYNSLLVVPHLPQPASPWLGPTHAPNFKLGARRRGSRTCRPGLCKQEQPPPHFHLKRRGKAVFLLQLTQCGREGGGMPPAWRGGRAGEGAAGRARGRRSLGMEQREGTSSGRREGGGAHESLMTGARSLVREGLRTRLI